MGTEGANPREKQSRSGGLYGKARYSRFRNRAWRLQSQQLIEEFVDPSDQKKKKTQLIPIKRRAEFVPSAPVLGSEYGVGTEQELELVYATESNDLGSEDGMFNQAYALISPESKEDSAITFSQSEKNNQRGKSDSGVQREERDALFARQQNRRSPDETASKQNEVFTAGGFVLGCAMGTAAAAVLLMMARVVLL